MSIICHESMLVCASAFPSGGVGRLLLCYFSLEKVVQTIPKMDEHILSSDISTCVLIDVPNMVDSISMNLIGYLAILESYLIVEFSQSSNAQP